MASNATVTVLLPNGHRQTVKVTLNTTILQVLDEVCQKHGYKAECYDVKHFNKILDASVIFRFSGLSNNAQLEMVPCLKERELLNITIGIQLEDGQRLMAEFSPNAVLSEILLRLVPDESTDTAILVYMHREIFGMEEFDKTTLKSLGLTKGRAMLRLLHRNPNQKKEQAHVYIPKKIKDTSKETENLSSSSLTNFISNKILDPIKSIKDEIERKKKKNDVRNMQEKEVAPRQVVSNLALKRDLEKLKNEESSITYTSQVSSMDKPQDEIEVEYLGERNALVFNQAGAKAIPREELPDSFFDLTVEDAKVLLRDAKKNLDKLEELPLLTESQRQLDNDKKTLSQLHKYQRAIIRIQFPDQLVLQGLFGPLETVQSIKDFIKTYLQNPEKEFTLYTSPPRKDLNQNFRLIDENLVPSSVIYYSGPSLLKSDLKGKMTDPMVATMETTRTRGTSTREFQENFGGQQMTKASHSPTGENSTSIPVPGTSRSQQCDDRKVQAPMWLKGFFK